jgi:hypothetical protein
MKKNYKVKEKNKTKLKSYLEKKPKKNERNTRHATSRNS